MLVLLAGYFGDPTDPRLIPGSVVDRARPPGDAVPRRRDRRGRRPPRASRRERALGQHRGDPHRRLPVRPRLRDLAPTWAPTSAGCSRGRSPCCATGRSARSTPPRRVDQTEANYLEIIRRKTGSLIAHVLPARRDALRRHRPSTSTSLEAFGEPLGHRLPALRRHHGHHRQPARAGQGARRRHAGGRLHRSRCSTRWRTARDREELARLLAARPARRRAARPGARRSSAAGRLDRARPSGRHGRGRPRAGARRAAPRGPRAARVGAARRASSRPAAERSRRAGSTLLDSVLGSALGKTFTSVPDYYSVLRGRAGGPGRGCRPRRRGVRSREADRTPSSAPGKLTTYECGIDPVGEGWSQSQVRYYIYGFLFVIFDVESVFLFPWARVFERLGLRRRWSRWAIFIGDPGASGCSTPGARGCWSGPDHRDDAAAQDPAGQVPAELGPPVLPVGHELRPGVLRDRVHRRIRPPSTTSSAWA